MASLTSPTGAKVNVDDSKVDHMLRMGFTKAEVKKEPAKKAASSSDKK